MKFKTTKKAMKESNEKIIGIGYCKAQFLLYYKNEIAYSSGMYGWACDYYNIDGVIISTGYSYISKNVDYDYELLKKYDDKAREVLYNNEYNSEIKKLKINNLLKNFIEEALR